MYKRKPVSLNKILFLTPYPFGFAPSQRFRFEQYLDTLTLNGHHYRIEAFFDTRAWENLYRKGHFFLKAAGAVSGFVRRLTLLFKIPGYSIVFIHREAIPFGPPWYEWVIARILQKKIIYDFDDAIWIKQASDSNPWTSWLKPATKTSRICRLSWKVCVGNEFLASYARFYNRKTIKIPTTIDTVSIYKTLKRHKPTGKVTIGWSGSHSTLPYLDEVVNVIRKLEGSIEIRFLVICNKAPSIVLNSLEYIEWNKETEVQDLLQIDIGLMPLVSTEWSEGKCGLKALQYMALGIPALVTPIGVNEHIVGHNVHGFHCNSSEDWYRYIELLIRKPTLREQLGYRGREKVKRCYSVASNCDSFLSLFSN